MDFEEKCVECGASQAVNWSNMASSPVEKFLDEIGFHCRKCGTWNVKFYTSPQLENNFRRLLEMKPTHASFWYYFVKARKRAEEIQRRGRMKYG